jgi:hypothetical protein
MKKYLLLLVLPILMYANIGKITVLKGDVKIKRDGQSIQAKSGTVLEKNDFIKTDKDGKVQIVFTDSTIFTVGKDSTLDIADYLYDESQPKNNKVQFNVLKGAFSSITGRIGKLNKSKFKLKTKSASIGIRGTIIKANQEVIMCTEGAITVTTNDGVAVRVESGYKTDISSGTPTEPELIQEGDEDALDVDIKVEDSVAAAAADNNEDEQKDQEEAVENDAVTTPDDAVASVKKETAEQSIGKDTIGTVEEAARNIKFTGRTIDKDGKQQLLTIDAQNIKGDLTIEGQDAVMTDNSGNEISSTKDETITWGHWADDPSKKWVAGQATDVQVLDSLRNSSSTVNAKYSGQVMGTVDGTDNIKMDSANEVKVNFELGGGKNTMDGSMKFDTQTGQEWNSEFGGTTSGSTFQATSLSGTSKSAAEEQKVTSGSVDGSFYGKEAEAVGGTFQLNTEANKATGVFKATK